MFKLRFPKENVQEWAERYGEHYDDSNVRQIGEASLKAGYLTREQLLDIASWKTRGRTQKSCRCNSESYVEEVTRVSFAASEPRLKIEVLRIMDGVQWPTASVILHFCDRDPWPIIDVRALWSLTQPDTGGNHSFALRSAYTLFTRHLAADCKVTMRVLDRALWAYSKENQPRKRR